MFRPLLVSVFCLGFSWGAVAEQADAPRPISAVDMVELNRLSSADLSPDGRYLLYKRSETNWDENKIVRRFVLMNLETGEYLDAPNPEDETDSARSAWWTADGSAILYLERDEDKIVQLHQFDVKTGARTQLTEHGSSIIDILLDESGEAIFFTAAALEDELIKTQTEKGWLIDAYDTPLNREVWRLDTATQSVEPVLQGDYSVRNVEISADGQTLSFSKVADHTRPAIHLGEVHTYELSSNSAVRWTYNDYRESNPQMSPDGSKLAYIATVNAEGEPYYEDKVFVQALGEAPERLLGPMAMEALEFAWDKTGQGLFILGNTGLSADLYHYTLATGELRQLTSGQHSVSSWRYYPESNVHLVKFESATSPGEFFILSDEGEDFQQVTDEYENLTKQFALPKQEAVHWQSRDGLTIEGLLVYPIGYEEGSSYPMVTITHGGPRNSSRFGTWNISRYVPVLAGQGYMVFLPNHRGGTGYGDAFVRDMYGAYFRNAHLDVMDGIDALIERGLADPEHLIKMGWSAGGHMVNKLITQTDRFKAASSGAGASDWLSMHGESDVRHTRSFVFGGSPWDKEAPREQYAKDSPLVNAWKVTTPTLFFSGEDDVRVPPTQSIMMHRGVEATGTPTYLYLAEGEPHNFRKPANQLFKINTELEWYARFALSEVYEPVLPDAAFSTDDDETTDTAVESLQATTP